MHTFLLLLLYNINKKVLVREFETFCTCCHHQCLKDLIVCRNHSYSLHFYHPRQMRSSAEAEKSSMNVKLSVSWILRFHESLNRGYLGDSFSQKNKIF
jgi:hypothetical protein